MPLEYDLTALKPFDYQGRSYAEGECFRADILGFICLVGTGKARRDVVAPAPVAPAKKRRGRPKKATT